MRSFQLLLTVAGSLLWQVSAAYYGSCAHDCIANLNVTNCNRDDSFCGWDCEKVCTDQPTLDAVNKCITSSCSSSDQNSIFANIAQACANKGSPITAAPAEATFAATSRGSLFASGFGSVYSSCASGGPPGSGIGTGFGDGWAGCNRPAGGNGWAGHCSWTTFTGNWGGWGVSWSGFSGDGDCSITTGSSLTKVTSPSGLSASITGTASPSLGATVTTTINGQTLTGTIFSAQGQAVATASGTTAIAAQNGGRRTNERIGAFAGMAIALLVAMCFL